jgi:hypothetical protein
MTDYRPEEVDFLLKRALAIKDYVSVEGSLAGLFNTLLGTSLRTSGIVFYRFINARLRNSVLDDLIGLEHQQNVPYWNSMLKVLRQVDARRNEIVHWAMGTTISSDGSPVFRDPRLTPPNFWANTPDTPILRVTDIEDFSLRCDFVSRGVNILSASISGQLERGHTWHEICRQPVAYPPPDNHPLSRNYEEPKTPPQPSGT